MRTYYPAQTATEISQTSMSRSRSQSPHAQSPTALSVPGSPMNTGVFSSVPLSTMADEELEHEELEAGYDSNLRLRYVAQAGLTMLAEKVKKNQEVTPEELMRLAAPEQLPDSEKLVPVHLDPSWVGGVQAALQRNGGPRGAAIALIQARDKAEVATDGETISAKEWRALMREADGVLKPYLFSFVALTALCSGTLLTLAADASRQFLLLLTLPHVGSEVLFLTYFLFGPQPGAEDTMWKPRWAARLSYLVGSSVVALAPLRSDGLAGPLSVGTHVFMASLADAACLWLGVFLCVQRLEVASRRLGGSLVCHGIAGQLASLEFLNPDLFAASGVGNEELRGWGWTLMVLATALSLIMIVPVFSARHLDMRTQHPSPRSAGVICALAFVTVLLQPLFALRLPDFSREPSFLPRGLLLTIYKMAASVGGVALSVYAVNAYNVAKQRPLSPTFATFVNSQIWRSLQWVD